MPRSRNLLFSLLVCAFLMPSSGCSSKPNSLATRIAFFNKHRDVFDSYIERIYAGQVESNDFSFALPQLLIDSDVKQVIRDGDCTEIVFWFMCTDPVPLLIYSPNGLNGVPEKYRNGGPNGRTWAYWKFVAIDDNWYYCEWDM